MRHQEGQRLETFVREHWTTKGGMRGLCSEAGIAPETLYRWFRGETEPDLGSVRQLADALKVTRAEVVAALDGQLPPPNWQTELAAEVERGMRTVLAEQGLALQRAERPERAAPARKRKTA